MERLADYISRVIRMESEGEVNGTPKSSDTSQSHAGRNSQRVCDQTGSPQRYQSCVRSSGQVREQDRCFYEGV